MPLVFIIIIQFIQMDPDVLKRIRDTFTKLEEENKVTIVFAVESGSRAWGFNADDSDYDIRFVYYRNDIMEYVTCLKKPDTICGFSDDKKLDWQGWDITKAIFSRLEISTHK